MTWKMARNFFSAAGSGWNRVREYVVTANSDIWEYTYSTNPLCPSLNPLCPSEQFNVANLCKNLSPYPQVCNICDKVDSVLLVQYRNSCHLCNLPSPPRANQADIGLKLPGFPLGNAISKACHQIMLLNFFLYTLKMTLMQLSSIICIFTGCSFQNSSYSASHLNILQSIITAFRRASAVEFNLLDSAGKPGKG